MGKVAVIMGQGTDPIGRGDIRVIAAHGNVIVVREFIKGTGLACGRRALPVGRPVDRPLRAMVGLIFHHVFQHGVFQQLTFQIIVKLLVIQGQQFQRMDLHCGQDLLLFLIQPDAGL